MDETAKNRPDSEYALHCYARTDVATLMYTSKIELLYKYTQTMSYSEKTLNRSDKAGQKPLWCNYKHRHL